MKMIDARQTRFKCMHVQRLDSIVSSINNKIGHEFQSAIKPLLKVTNKMYMPFLLKLPLTARP